MRDAVVNALADRPRRWFVTGGAGFIGSHVVDLLVSAGHQVTVYDNLSLSTDQYIAEYARQGKITFIKRDLTELEPLVEAMAGHDVVFHLAANTDIPSGFTKHRIDLDNDVIATWSVLEAMVKTGVKEILFSSTGAVYGESIQGTFNESSGPLVPLSLYGAGKIASEAFISAYCNLFGIRAWIFRFGNVIGERTNHGVIYDFIAKLKKSPKTLEVLGTGQGREELLPRRGVHPRHALYMHHKLSDGPFPVLVNLGTDSTTKVMDIGEIIIEEMGLPDVDTSSRGRPADGRVISRSCCSTRTAFTSSAGICRRTSTRGGAQRGPPAARHREVSPDAGHAVVKRARREAAPSACRHLAPRRGQRRRVRREGLSRDRRRVRRGAGAQASEGRAAALRAGLEELTRKHLRKKTLRFSSDPAAAAEADYVVIATIRRSTSATRSTSRRSPRRARRVAPHLGRRHRSSSPASCPSDPASGSRPTLRAAQPGLALGRRLHAREPAPRLGDPALPRTGHAGAGRERRRAGRRGRAALYKPFKTEKLAMDLRSAEMVKHALNAFLATSITFINEIANLSDRLGADAVAVGRALKLDKRIGKSALMMPGLGFSGGTLARDVTQLRKFSTELGYEAKLLDAIVDVNEGTFDEMVVRLQRKLGPLAGKRVGVLGLTYKPGHVDGPPVAGAQDHGQAACGGRDLRGLRPEGQRRGAGRGADGAARLHARQERPRAGRPAPTRWSW